jgi:hypothetical protein
MKHLRNEEVHTGNAIGKVQVEIEVKGATPFQRFEEAAKTVFKVSKRSVDKAEARSKKEKAARHSEQPH